MNSKYPKTLRRHSWIHFLGDSFSLDKGRINNLLKKNVEFYSFKIFAGKVLNENKILNYNHKISSEGLYALFC